jgi:hypothetical protein
VTAEAPFIDRFKWALRDDRSLSQRYGGRQAANIKLLLCMLMLRYPNICPSGPTIMADCGWSDERTLTKTKKQAIEAGWLVQVHKGTGPGDSSTYGLRIPELPASNAGTSNAGTSNAGTSNAGTSNAGTSNAGELPASNAENYLHEMGVKDTKKDPNEDPKADRASSNSGHSAQPKESAQAIKDQLRSLIPGYARLWGDRPEDVALKIATQEIESMIRQTKSWNLPGLLEKIQDQIAEANKEVA